jgi:hypothetical protein
MTILDAFGEAHEQKTVAVDGLADLLVLGSGFEADRLNLSEKYAADIKLYEDSLYEQVEHIRFRVYLPTTDTAVGDRQTYLMQNHILQNYSEAGYCLATAIRTNWPKGTTPNFSSITNELFTEMTGFGAEGVQISQLSHVESAVQVTTRKGKVYKPQFVVLDQRFQTVRLPEWTPRNKNNKQLCHLVVHNGHFYLCRDANMARDNVQRDVGRVQAMAKSCGLEGIYEDAWKRFVRHQNILPDQVKFWQAIADE